MAPPSAHLGGLRRSAIRAARWSAEGRPSSLATMTSEFPRRILTSHTRPVGRPSVSWQAQSTSTLIGPPRAPALPLHLGEQYRRGRPRPLDAGNGSSQSRAAHRLSCSADRAHLFFSVPGAPGRLLGR